MINPHAMGFTGTQVGMTAGQKEELQHVLMDGVEIGFTHFHHGDCVGADEQAHDCAKALGYLIVIHPPLNPSKRAYCVGYETREPKDYLDRNHDIVEETAVLIAAPKQRFEVQRSGTWATVRYAWQASKRVALVMP
jgi:hypothetical protein